MPLRRVVLLLVVLAGATACDDKHRLHEQIEIALPDAAAERPALALTLADSWHCEPVAETVSVPLVVSVGAGGYSATAARVSADRCLLLVGAPTAPPERRLAGAAVVFKRAQVAVTELIAADYTQFADCLPAAQFRVVEQCPAGLSGLP